MNNTAFCITGWHFREDFFKQIGSLSGIDYYVISHKSPRDVPAYVYEFVGNERILFRPNIGYDWGCYQQFLDSGLWRDYETIFFMHDDIEIHDPGFVQASQKLLRDYGVVGNGVGKGSVSYTRVDQHPYAYAHSRWKPTSYTFSHHTLRGSYFVTSRELLATIGSFEVYWDLLALNIDFGNWSTKASCGKMEDYYGPDCIGFLSETFGRSEYITEFFRGENQEDLYTPGGYKKNLYSFLKRLSRVYMEIYYQERKRHFRSGSLLVLRLFLGLFSGRIS